MHIIWLACLSALPLNGTPLDRLPSHYPTLPGITASPRTLWATPLVVLDRGRQPCETASRATRRLTCHELAINDLMLTQNHLENRCAPLDDTMNKKSNGGFLHSPKGDSSVNQAINNIFSSGHDHAYNTPLADLDVSDPTLWPNQAMWAVFKRLRDEDPLHYCKDGWNSIARSPEDETVGPYWSVTRYEDIMAIDTDHHRFSSEPFITLQNPADDFPLPMFIAMDQPKHDIQRQTIAPVVASPSLSRMSELIRERTQTVLDEIPLNEEFDWVDTVSIELTTMMLATLFDFPFEDRRKLTRWSDVATASPETGIVESETQRRAELMECVEYFMALWQQRIGKEGHDLITLLANGENTRDMEPMEYLGNLILLIVGGNDTTRNSMSGSVYGSHLFPSEWEKVRANRDLIPNTVSEIIRWQTPLAYMRRTALEDVELHGKTIKAGDKVAMWYASGNRDERKFDDPDTLLFDRKNARNHISFGFGIHRCFGNRLAEMQLQILWEEMLQRFSKIEVVAEPRRNLSSFVKGYTEMKVICRG